MHLVRRLVRTGRSLAALLLLAAFAAGSAADLRHHLSDGGCPSDRAGGADHCVCASLHAAPAASAGVTQVLPVECERTVTPVAEALAPIAHAATAAAPRAPPRG